MDSTARQIRQPDITREKLLDAAIEAFARDGFNGVSLKALSQASGVNAALVSYHFGNKEGLYLAAFDHIAVQLRVRLHPRIAKISQELEGLAGSGRKMPRKQAFAHLLEMLGDMLEVMCAPESASWAQLITKEQQSPGPAFEGVYQGVMGKVLNLAERLAQMACAPSRQPLDRTLMPMLLGQILVFRVSRAGVIRYMNWSEIGDREIKAIRDQFARNLSVILGVPL